MHKGLSSEPEGDPVELTIPLERVCDIILKLREFDVKDAVTEPDAGSNPSDDGGIAVLEDHPDDPVEEELRSQIGYLTEDEQIDLIALVLLGRDGSSSEEWPSTRAEAARLYAERPRRATGFLMSDPLSSDYLEEGLSLCGLSCEDASSS